MKEEQRPNIIQEERREFPEETMEQVMNNREINHIGGESLDNLGRDENRQYTSDSFLDHASSRSLLRGDSVPVEGTSDVGVDALMMSPVVSATSEDDTSQQSMEKWALDNAPPPVKLHREGENSEQSSPKELSPPPSPKRMREVERKGKVFSQGSI